MKIEWKPVVSLDTIIAAALVLGALLSMYVDLNARLVAVETKIDPVWSQVIKGGR